MFANDCQQLTSFCFMERRRCDTSASIFFAFSLFELLEAILDSLGPVNRKGFLNSNIRAVFV